MSTPPGIAEQIVQVETPEQVVVSYTVAGVGSRAAAALIDYLICLGWFLVLFIPTCFATLALPATTRSAVAPWILGVFLVLGQFGVLWGYYVLYEGLADGQTPGKRRLGLRVVQDGGYSVSFAASSVRNLVRLLDMQPGFFYAVGLVSVATSRSGKRIGDMVAGTIVVRERAVQLRLPAAQSATDAAPVAIATLLTDDEYHVLERFMARRQALDAERRRQLADGLVARFADRIGPREGDSTPQATLVRLYERERQARASGVAARSDTGAAREQHALVALGAPRWRDFAARVAEVQRRGLRSLREGEVSEFAAEYRAMATDLARLQTAARGREIDALFYLSRLVAAGHNLLYRQKPLVWSTVWRYMTVTVPRELRRSAAAIGAAAVMLFGPAAIAFTVVHEEPRLAAEFLPEPMLDRADNAARRAREGVGYIDDPEGMRPVLAGAIIANNVRVTYLAFAAGATAGIGTVAALVFNGILLGGFAGLYTAYGVGELLLAFVAPHGVLELSAIAIGGGGGLLIAAAILFPGARTRGEALVIQGRRAMRLIAAATLLLLIAGVIEGLISPIPYWDLPLKLIVSAATLLFLVVYVTRGRHGEPDAPADVHAYSDARPLSSR